MPDCLTGSRDNGYCLLFCMLQKRLSEPAEPAYRKEQILRPAEGEGEENKMTKFRWFYNTDKETEWLNHMAAQGWAMKDFCLGFYRFERCEPGEYIYQVDVSEKLLGVSEEYRQFMEETQTEIVCTWGFWVFLRRKAEEGPFRMYTDVESTIRYYTKIKDSFGTVEIIQAAGLLSGIYGAVIQDNPFGWMFALFAGLCLLPLLWQTVHLKQILKELKNRQEETILQPDKIAQAHVLWKRVAIVASLFGAPVLYAVLHELGHCIAVWICGGTVTGFYPFDTVRPHMTYEGVWSEFSQALVHISGSAIPLAAAVAVLLFWKGSKKHPLLNICAGIISGIFLVSTLSWIVEPVGYLMNRFDYGSDVSKFIEDTGLHPVIVMLCALFIFGLTCLLFFKRRARLSLGFMDRKFTTRFFSFLITTCVVFLVLLYFGTVGADTILAEGNIQFAVPADKNSILQEEHEILVTEPGEYTCYVEWMVNREGAVAGIMLKSADGVSPLSCTGNWLNAEFAAFHLDSGSYTLSFYFLSCWEDWLEFCEITGAEVSDLSDYVWEPDSSATVTGKYRIMRKQPDVHNNKSEGNSAAGGNQGG